MDRNIYREAGKLLRKEGYLKKYEVFTFTHSEEVATINYNNDLYQCTDTSIQTVRIYWGHIKRRKTYYEVYLTVISADEKVLAVINNGTVELQKKL